MPDQRREFIEHRLKRSQYDLVELRPHAEKSLKFQDVSATFSRLALGSLVALNGGGLISIPAVVSAVETTSGQLHAAYIGAAITYIIGLTAAMISMFVAYLNYWMHASHAYDDYLWFFGWQKLRCLLKN